MAKNPSEPPALQVTIASLELAVEQLTRQVQLLTKAVDDLTDEVQWRNNRDSEDYLSSLEHTLRRRLVEHFSVVQPPAASCSSTPASAKPGRLPFRMPRRRHAAQLRQSDGARTATQDDVQKAQ